MGFFVKGSSARALPLEDDEEEDKGLQGSKQANAAPLLKVNQAFAERLAHNKQREALQRLQELKKRGVVDSSDDEDDDEDDESSDDGLLPAQTDARIFETLAKIKQRDPSIYSLESKFFDDNDEDEDESEELVQPTSKPHKPVYLKDAIARQIIEEGSADLDEDDLKSKKKRMVTYADEQQSYKDEFLRSAKLDEDLDEGSDFLKLRRKVQPEVTDLPEIAPHDKDISHRLEEYFGKDENLDENDRFLKDYLLKKSWVDEDTDRIPLYEEIVGDVIADEEELEKQDRFEADYNFRFEEGESSQVMGHSRIVEDSVRRKDDSRKQKREKKKDRLSEAAFERREELKRLKNLKKKEILEKVKKIRTVAGSKESDGNLFQVEDLEEEFDPEEYDRKMREAFGEEYYGAEDADENFRAYDTDDSEKPNFEEEDERLGLPKGWDEDGVGSSVAGFVAAHRRAKEVNLLNPELGEDNVEEKDMESDGLESDKESEEVGAMGTHGDGESLSSQSVSKRKKKAKISLREKLAFDKQLEEYYKLDYEDMVGDLPTRFKYRQVKPSMYGLTTSELLAADDKDLNQYVSLKKIAPYVTQEWKPKWRFQISQKMRKKKALKQRRTEKEDHRDTTRLVDDGDDVKGPDAGEEVPGQGFSAAEGSKRKRKRRKKGLSLSESRLIAYGKISLPSRKRKRG